MYHRETPKERNARIVAETTTAAAFIVTDAMNALTAAVNMAADIKTTLNGSKWRFLQSGFVIPPDSTTPATDEKTGATGLRMLNNSDVYFDAANAEKLINGRPGTVTTATRKGMIYPVNIGGSLLYSHSSLMTLRAMLEREAQQAANH